MHLPDPDPSTICSLIHISDPHFGSGIVNSGNTWWRKLIARIPCINQITGYYPHDYQVALALAVAVRHILKDRAQREIPTLVVHTGDLTAGGKLAEFSTGATFLRSAHLLPSGAMAGFRLDQRNEIPFDIPGNHDLWSRGSPKLQSPFSEYYGGSYPIQLHPPVETPRGKVRLYGLDSNRSSLWAHRLANGEVPHHQLQQLSTLLTECRKENSIKIVCLHHPVDVHPSDAPKILGFEILKLRKRAQVAQFFKDQGVHLVLAGHVHRRREYQATPTSPLQIVAGSSCQIGNAPSFALLDIHPTEITCHQIEAAPGNLHFLPTTSRKLIY